MIYINIINFVLINYFEKDHSLIENFLFKKCCCLFPNNVKFFAVKKIYKHIQRYSTKMLVHGNVYLERPLEM